MFPALLLFCLVSAAQALPGPVGVSEGLTESLMENYLDAVLLDVKKTLINPIPIEDLDWGIDDIYGIPFKLRLKTKGGKLAKPGDVKRMSDVAGFQEISGTAHVKGFMYLGQLTVQYDTFSVNIFGLEIKGKAAATLYDTITPVTITVYQNTVTKRNAEATIGELRGALFMNLGSGNSYTMTIVNYLLDVLFSLRYIKDVFVWAFFENIITPLESAISTAAGNIQI